MPTSKTIGIVTVAFLENDRNCYCRILCRDRRSVADGDKHGHVTANQIGCQLRQPSILILGPANLADDVLSFDIASILEALPDSFSGSLHKAIHHHPHGGCKGFVTEASASG
jgi:hypothetical protein